MNTISKFFLAATLLSSVVLTGCAQSGPQAANSQEAIGQSQAMATTQEKIKYLVSQANSFLNSKNFDQAINTAQYVVSNLDANSADAKSIIEKAKAELQKAGQQAVNDLKGKMGSFGQ